MKTDKKKQTNDDLIIGETYNLLDKNIVVKPSDEYGCNHCTFENSCARFTTLSKRPALHTLCAGKFRNDRTPVFFAKSINK